jgi:hypothetical protein
MNQSQISDTELCTDTRTLVQQMKNFERERWAQHDKAVDQFRVRAGTAKNKQDQERVRKESNDELNSFLYNYQKDFDDKFREPAKRLRSELLIRLKSEERSQARSHQILFDGPLVGAYPVLRLANILENLGKRVCPTG